ncbi:MAG: hypothetical protein ABIJ97_01480 [Bacteroidota bacterium]
MKKEKINYELWSFILSLLIMFTTMFNNELRDFILKDWQSIMFFIGVLLFIFSIISYIMRRICRNIIKSEFGEIVDNNKIMGENISYILKTMTINQALMNELLERYSTEDLIMICKSVRKKNKGICYNNETDDPRLPNLKDYGIKPEIIKKLLLEELENKKNQIITP